MDATSQKKVIAAGFTIIRREDYPTVRIKKKDSEHYEWVTHERFPTKAARNRVADTMLQDDFIVEDQIMTENAKRLGNQSVNTEMYFRQNGEAETTCSFETQTYSGLTKREYFAAMAMQGASATDADNVKKNAKWSVGMADALLEELSKED